MKGKLTMVLFGVLVCASSGFAQSTARQSFDTLKGLAGEWRGEDSLGHQVEITFRVASGGTALLSELVEPSHQKTSQKEDMISMIHLDGSRLLLTHYCGAGNQPRMKGTTSPDGNTITFDFVDATNLSSPSTGHMQRVVIRILSPGRHTEEWTFVENGRESKDLFDMQRTGS